MITEFTYKGSGGRLVHTPLSNFFVEPDETTVEHEYQAAKTHSLVDKVAILTAATAKEAKMMGRSVTLRKDWDDVKVQVMRDLLLVKFLDHTSCAQYLVDTGDEYLVEGNWWHDNFWGRCNCYSCRNKFEQWKPGDEVPPVGNHLGLLLMEIRDLVNMFGG